MMQGVEKKAPNWLEFHITLSLRKEIQHAQHFCNSSIEFSLKLSIE